MLDYRWENNIINPYLILEMMKKKDLLFSSSEIGQFTFCSVNWFLKRKGYYGPPSRKSIKKKSYGLKVHDYIGKKNRSVNLLIRLSYYLFIIGGLLMFLVFISKWFGLFG